MKKLTSLLTVVLFTLLACEKEDSKGSTDLSGLTSGTSNTGNGSQPQAGVITAGEWNDLDHWDFWSELMNDDDLKNYALNWGMNTDNRVSVLIKNNLDKGQPGIDVKLTNGADILCSGLTDKFGKVELWPNMFGNNPNIDLLALQLNVADGAVILDSISFGGEENAVTFTAGATVMPKAMVSFVVDATGSMGDEMQYLKVELGDVIKSAMDNNPSIDFMTSAVFYRDNGDEYITRVFEFTGNQDNTIDFIRKQSADGGGDVPEAVHAGLSAALDLDWETNVQEKIIFLLLDAPPHNENQVIASYQKSLQKAAAMGIKIIPITASGIKRETEFLMRLTAISTNGTYVFITNHSGVGNDHLEPTIGLYEVEYLNDLMKRLINKYL